MYFLVYKAIMTMCRKQIWYLMESQ